MLKRMTLGIYFGCRDIMHTIPFLGQGNAMPKRWGLPCTGRSRGYRGVAPQAAAGGTVVLVESPAKAKKIQNYLGDDYKVLASYGHVRDLQEKNGSVDPAQDFHMRWEVPYKAKQRMEEIRASLKGAKALILATDPDREGEAISWHLREELASSLSGVDTSRITFTEVTKSAVLAAMQAPREISQPLVDAYRARRALDYLVGYHISPILWRKLPGARSAGRVQSVALRLISDRESAIEKFEPQEYWSLDADLQTGAGTAFKAFLTEVDHAKISKQPITMEEQAQQIQDRLMNSTLMVASTSDRDVTRQPPPPFITSTLQQEASSKLGFSPDQTMSIAQQLYEGRDSPDGEGFITYMRTDGVTIGEEALSEIREVVESAYGRRFLVDKPRTFKSKAKNAQEAHEAIRPTSMHMHPTDLPPQMPQQSKRLYDLIWRRTLATQMSNAVFNQVGADVASKAGDLVLRATTRRLVFEGYQAAYATSFFQKPQSSDDEDDQEDSQASLLASGFPDLKVGEVVQLREAFPEQHFTNPPARYTEASAVKALEEYGIGRPSTYAAVMKVLQDRGYVVKEGRALHVESLGRVLAAFLSKYFEKYVDFGFTSSVEDLLDGISAGDVDWRRMLKDFWEPFDANISQVSPVAVREVVDELDAMLGPHFLPPKDGETEAQARQCPHCADGVLGIKLSRGGGFIGCSRYPECGYARSLTTGEVSDDEAALAGTGVVLGKHPDSGVDIRLRRGPYGYYLEMEVPSGKPKRVSLPGKMVEAGKFDLAQALKMLRYPVLLGSHPESGEEVLVCIGTYGPYIRWQGISASIPKSIDPCEVTMEQAVGLLEKKAAALAAKASKYPAKAGKASAKAGKGKGTKGQQSEGSQGPKKTTGYMLFCKSRREELQASEQRKGMKQSEIMALLGAEWKQLTEQHVGEWKEKAKLTNDLAGAVSSSSGEHQSAKEEHARKRGDSDQPKKLSGYNLYCKNRRQELQASGKSKDMSQPEIMKLLAGEWKELSEHQKEALKEEAKGLSGQPQQASKPSKNAKQPSAYLKFCSERRAALKAEGSPLSSPETMKLLGAEWRKLSEKEKLSV